MEIELNNEPLRHTPSEVLLSLQQPRESILKAAVQACQQLACAVDWQEPITDILGRLGRASNASRLYVRQHDLLAQGHAGACFQWDSPESERQHEPAPPHRRPLRDSILQGWDTILGQGRIVCGRVDDLPEPQRDMLMRQGVCSVMVLPVFTDQQWWGLIGLEDHHHPRDWSQEEIECLQSVAEALGGAIRRQQDHESLKRSHADLERRLERFGKANPPIEPRLAHAGGDLTGDHGSSERNSAFLKLLQDVAVASNEASGCDGALQTALTKVCRATGWPVGHVYKVVEGPPKTLEPTRLWHLDHPDRFETFRKVSEATSFDIGIGLPGRVLASGQPAWIYDVTLDPNFPRAKLVKHLGVRAGFAFPVLVGRDVAAVLEFFSAQAAEPDPRLLEVMAHVGTQLGRVIERTRSEKRLIRSEQRYRSLVDQAPVGIAHVAFDGRFLRVNPQLCRIFGYTQQELTRMRFADITHRDDLAMSNQHVQQLLSGTTDTVEFQKRYIRKDQTLIWANLTVAVVESSPSEPKYFVSVIEDITDSKQAEEALRESERRFRRIFDHSDDAIFLIDPEHDRFVDANDAACRMLGHERSVLLAKRMSEIHPDDIAILKQISEKVVSQGTGRVEEHLDWIRAGCSIPIEVSASILRIDHHTCVLAHVRNITERKKAQAQVLLRQRAMESASNGIMIADALRPGTPIVYVNSAFERITGFSKDEVIGRGLQSAPPGDAQERSGLDDLLDTIAQKRELRVKLQSKRKDGSPFWSELSVSPIRNDNGDVTHFVGIQNDITERVKAQEQARQHQAELAHVARLNTVGELASGLAHEINQPLAAISNYTQACAQQIRSGNWTSQELVNTLQKTSTQCHRAAQIIRRLRDFISRKEPQRFEIDINELIRKVTSLLEPDARYSRATIDLDLYAKPLPVHADGIQIEQVVVNLAKNSLEAMDDARSPVRELTIRTMPIDEKKIGISLRDTGTGLSRPVLEQIFDPFFTTKPEGMGMGLSISRSIVESHGGRLSVIENGARGATFQFTLPYQPVVARS